MCVMCDTRLTIFGGPCVAFQAGWGGVRRGRGIADHLLSTGGYVLLEIAALVLETDVQRMWRRSARRSCLPCSCRQYGIRVYRFFPTRAGVAAAAAATQDLARLNAAVE